MGFFILQLNATVLVTNGLGDSTVGKSAITQSLVSDGTQFAKTYNMVGHYLTTAL